ncbi:cofactor-independent phosphoglycerate mutase [Eubacteriales bacterium OttesenSCG-928-K08]|nr:cofactor-independent phosphoglycerate mutase [Eubacteriales bacterium OttesenSCG-928-K08]
MKYLLVIGDGMADNPVPELSGKTPIEAANKPCMDALAAKGEFGTVRTIPEGMAPGSESGILTIFGYDPRTYLRGRSPLEAASCGVLLKEDEISYRCNMVSLGGDGPLSQRSMRSHSTDSISGEDSIALLHYLLADERFAQATRRHGFCFHETPSFRHILVQKGGSIDGFNATPPHDILGQAVSEYLPTGTGSEALRELMELSVEILANAPLNAQRESNGLLRADGIWPWAAGAATILPPFSEKYGKSGSVISGAPLVQGIAILAGMEAPNVEGATGTIDTNYAGKVAAACDALKTHDFVCIHIEAPDECTHCGDLEGKINSITYVDQLVLAPMIKTLEDGTEPFRVLVMPDHKTLMKTLTHDADPVPYFIYDSQSDKGSGLAYSEAFAAKTGIHVENGHTLMERLFETGKAD